MKTFITWLVVCTIIQSLEQLRPGAQWSLHGDQYSGIEWIDKTQTMPTEKEIGQAVSDCIASQTAKKAETDQALLDAKNTSKTADQRLDALIKAIDLK